MNVRLLSLSLIAAAGLVGCGSSEPPAPPPP
ncbi:energy transducer TonB, partial [Stenotrophomonas maltophilia]